MEQAIFAAGSFWDLEAAFRQTAGVVATETGYTGGWLRNPSYEQVCADTTGHAEAVRVVYDPRQVTYQELLEVFWDAHDPTTVNRQGADVGSQYRSAIFCVNPGQARLAHASKAELERSGRYGRHIVTEIRQAGVFYPAEEYHQQYWEKRRRRQQHG